MEEEGGAKGDLHSVLHPTLTGRLLGGDGHLETPGALLTTVVRQGEHCALYPAC